MQGVVARGEEPLDREAKGLQRRPPFQAIEIPPAWRIVAPSGTAEPEAEGIRIILRLGAGWGTGAHETTQLCLQAISAIAPRGGGPWGMLDFGSGSGILGIGAAKLGATVEAIEIDELAIENAQENFELNSLASRIRCSRTLDALPGPFDLVVANILRSVLLHFAEELVARVAQGATLVLSGLVSTDVPEVSVRYASLLGGQRPQVFELGDWRALTWKRGRALS